MIHFPLRFGFFNIPFGHFCLCIVISVYYSHPLFRPHDGDPTSCLLCRVLDAVDAADHLLLLLRFPPPPHQAEDTAGAETEGDQPDRLQRGLHLPILHAGPQYVSSNSLHVRGCKVSGSHLEKFLMWAPGKLFFVYKSVNLTLKCI